VQYRHLDIVLNKKIPAILTADTHNIALFGPACDLKSISRVNGNHSRLERRDVEKAVL
jgi:hypothetical protein